MVRNDDGTIKEFYDEATESTYDKTILKDGEPFSLIGEAEAPKDLVQEVELGRLNISRAPDKVLDRALKEALSNLVDPFFLEEFAELVGMVLVLQESITVATEGLVEHLETQAFFCLFFQGIGDEACCQRFGGWF